MHGRPRPVPLGDISQAQVCFKTHAAPVASQAFIPKPELSRKLSDAFSFVWLCVFGLCAAAMASVVAAASTVVAPAAFAAAFSTVGSTDSKTSVRAFAGLKTATLFSATSQSSLSAVSNGSRVHCMQVWNPIDNIKFETLSYLPVLSDDTIAKQIDYMIQQKLIPCLEFDPVGTVSRTNNRSPGYYDGRYWTMWKLPMFGCQDASQVLREIQECKTAYPQCYVRVMGFDNVKQVQIVGFLVGVPGA